MSRDHRRPTTIKIAVIGNIGAGKSTLVEKLSEHYGDRALIVSEPVKKWQGSGILETYYKILELPDGNREKALFQWFFQGKVLLDRLAEIRRVWRSKSAETQVLLFDSHPIADAAFTQMYKPLSGYEAIHQWYSEMLESLLIAEDCYPTLLVHVATPPETCLEQIKLRSRTEESSIAVDYLQGLSLSFQHVYERFSGQKVQMNVNGSMDAESLFSRVLQEIGEGMPEREVVGC